MRRRRRKIDTDSAAASGGQLLALSLFIMMLAFFIILNAISNYEQAKVKPVLKSLETALSSKVTERDDEVPPVTPDAARFSGEGDALEHLQSLFASEIPSNTAKIDRSEGTMHVTLSLDDFEAAVMAMGAPEEKGKETGAGKILKGFFLPALIALVKNDAVGKPYRMDIMANIGGNPAAQENRDPQRLRQMETRLSAIARKMGDSGLPERLMSVGLKKGSPGTVELLFRPHIPYSPMGGKNG